MGNQLFEISSYAGEKRIVQEIIITGQAHQFPRTLPRVPLGPRPVPCASTEFVLLLQLAPDFPAISFHSYTAT